MANSFTNVGLIQQVNGENSGTWGDYVDTDWDIVTLLVGGVSAQSVTVADVTPANVDGTADAGKSNTFVCSGVLTGNRALILPTKPRQFIVTNNCTGAFTLTVKTAAGTGVVIPQTGTVHLYCDGTNILNATSGAVITVGTIAGTAITTSTFDGGTMGGTTPVQAQGYRPLNTQTGTTYGIVLADAGKTITLSNAGAVTVTIPANASIAFTVGTEIDLISLGAGIVTVAITSDTLLSKGSKVTLTGQYSGATLKKITSTSWVLIGDLT